MNKEEYLNSLTKNDILLGISRYLFDYKDEIPEDVSPEDIWNTIVDLEILNVI
jgi:hypothetical protein